jgi:superfamily II DNA helicase RecQ
VVYKFFYIPVRSPADAEAELNAFLARHTVQTVDRQFIAAGEHSAWSLCVVYDEAREPGGQHNRRKGGIDYREVLDASDFDVFSELRRLRKRLAEEQAVPPYTIFSNEQLAAMVTGRVKTLTDLRAIDGVGQARCERYGEAFLGLLRSLQPGPDEPPKDGPEPGLGPSE